MKRYFSGKKKVLVIGSCLILLAAVVLIFSMAVPRIHSGRGTFTTISTNGLIANFTMLNETSEDYGLVGVKTIRKIVPWSEYEKEIITILRYDADGLVGSYRQELYRRRRDTEPVMVTEVTRVDEHPILHIVAQLLEPGSRYDVSVKLPSVVANKYNRVTVVVFRIDSSTGEPISGGRIAQMRNVAKVRMSNRIR